MYHARTVYWITLFSAVLSTQCSLPSAQTLPAYKPPPEGKPAKNGVLKQNIDLKYDYNEIYNPRSGSNDSLWLRVYNGSLVGPTLRTNPGDTMEITLNHLLPKEDEEACQHQDPNIPHCFNLTNLHYHGLHVSPVGNSDNVLLSLAPKTQFDYEVKIPGNHPAGTFWYHSHRHGSVALQVSSGMAGALIIQGKRTLKDKETGGVADIDPLLGHSDPANSQAMTPFAERIWVFNQTPYNCVPRKELKEDKDNTFPDKKIRYPKCTTYDPESKTAKKHSNYVGQLEGYKDNFGPDDWRKSGRFTSVNGVARPLMEFETGRYYRLRMIHAGVRETVTVSVYPSPETVSGKVQTGHQALIKAGQNQLEQEQALLKQITENNKPLLLWEFAMDGITRDKFRAKNSIILQPGYRNDALLAFNEPGDYILYDGKLPAEKNVNRQTEDPKVIAFIKVKGDQKQNFNSKDHLSRILIDNLQRQEDSSYKAQAIADMKDLKLTLFNPIPSISAEEQKNAQREWLNFNIDLSDPTRFLINAEPYDPNRIDRRLLLGQTSKWRLTSSFVNHPYHIHVNPFQIQQISCGGQSVFPQNSGSNAEACDDSEEYCDLEGVWRDTIFVREGCTVEMATRHEVYIGEFVLHCHILDHEDQGMMQNVSIVNP